MTPKTIIAFGYHDQEAPRHWNIRKKLEAEGFAIRECHTNKKGLFAKYRDLARQFRAKGTDTETLLVTFPGHIVMPLAWYLTRKSKPRLIFDAFLSLHDTLVHDRKKIAPWNPLSFFLFIYEWTVLHLADEVWIDTQEHRKFLIRRFALDPDRVKALPVGTRADLFKPGTPHPYRGGRFEILFYGTYIPLQGIEFILGAAEILQESYPDAHITLVGSGQTYPAMRSLAEGKKLRNVTFRSRVPYEELPHMIRSVHCCLGIFGTSGKAARVIPHKVYDAVACGVPVITADTPAIHEQFDRHPLVILCRAGDPKDLAEKIIRLLP